MTMTLDELTAYCKLRGWCISRGPEYLRLFNHVDDDIFTNNYHRICMLEIFYDQGPLISLHCKEMGEEQRTIRAVTMTKEIVDTFLNYN